MTDSSRRNSLIEQQFAQFQAVLGAVREIRSRQSIPPRESIHFAVQCDTATCDLLRPMEPYFESMACAIQFVCYFFTMLAAAITYMMARQ